MKTHFANERGAKLASLATILVVAVGASGAGYWFGTRHARVDPLLTQGAVQSPGSPATAGVAKVAAERKVLYWHDPMVPGQRFDKPGKSPFMDMQLVPVYSDAGAEVGARAARRSVRARCRTSACARPQRRRAGSTRASLRPE